MDAASGRSGEALRLDRVTKVFSGRTPVTALQEVSFRADGGSLLSVLGPSGCGKSTLVRLIGGLERASSGSITVVGETCEAMRRKRGFGIVFQSPVLFDWRTVEANVALPLEIMRFPREQVRERTAQLLQIMGLADFRTHRPWQLSGGMQQRVSIARALSFEPPFLLMDEPFGALDMMTRERMQAELLGLRAAKPEITVIFITHSIAEAVLLSDRIVLMSARPGRVLRIIDVDLPRPRGEEVRESASFRALESEIRQLVLQQEFA